MQLSKWDRRFMEMTRLVSSWSKDPDHGVGAVLTSFDNRVLSTGYNGLPKNIDEYDEANKLAMTVHAEVNCLISAANKTYWTLYVTRFPCSSCAALVIQMGVLRLVCPPIETESSWCKSMTLSHQLLVNAGVRIIRA